MATYRPVSNHALKPERFAVTDDDLPSGVDVLVAMSPKDVTKVRKAGEVPLALPLFSNLENKS